jgi:hypothetical protein
MKIKIIEEAGHQAAVTGMRFSHQVECPLDDIVEAVGVDTKTVRTLAKKDGGHNKFLESIMVWMDIQAPLYFWKQFDTYRVGITKQSKSTMHSIMKRELTQEDFEKGCETMYLEHLNTTRENKNFSLLVNDLPDGYLQTRRVCLSYKSIRHILMQREHHKLGEWAELCSFFRTEVKYPSLLGGV